MSLDGKHLFLGRFDEEIHAAIAYDVAAKLCYGKYARTNVLTRIKEHLNAEN